MAGRAVAEWWFKMKPYALAYRELWPSLAITAVLFYKISYGGKKAVKDSKGCTRSDIDIGGKKLNLLVIDPGGSQVEIV
ncbi:ATP synthase subunit ATP5MJ, mitochondrial [Narcine bancroftii]|uniref:ATP synthase subunit ATP5MJ, mitochondrial n=1 Tax=Narcine bancroftii TaxID=1343680 RepID=UPI00383229DB